MKVDLGILGKLTRAVIFLLFIAGLMAVGVWYLPLIHHNENLRKALLERDQQIQKVEESNRQLKAEIDSLRFDPKAVERLAREKLGYAKAGETIFRFEDAGTNRSAWR
jgi:cell division protein FtsB